MTSRTIVTSIGLSPPLRIGLCGVLVILRLHSGDADQLKEAREIAHSATLINALSFASVTNIQCGNYATAMSLLDELIALADETGAASWKPSAMLYQGIVLALTGNPSAAVQMITPVLTTSRSMGRTLLVPMILSYSARGYAELGLYLSESD